MKKISIMGLLIMVGFMSHNAFALSFPEGTVFLNAQTLSECEAQNGNFIDWYGEIYCTESMMETSTEMQGEVILGNMAETEEIKLEQTEKNSLELENQETLSETEEMNADETDIDISSVESEIQKMVTNLLATLEQFIQETLESLMFWK
jgi:hypothetical protein